MCREPLNLSCRVAGIDFGTLAIEFSAAVMIPLAGSFAEGEDCGSLDLLSITDIGYGKFA